LQNGGESKIEKLVFGKNGQVHFDSVEERDEAVEYIKNTPENVDYNYFI
jgi:hypothetical protein